MLFQSPFFTLPREVRDEIYTFLLLSPIDPPRSPEQAGVRYREDIRDYWENRSVLYPPHFANNGPASALSQCNHQLRREILELSTNRSLTKGTKFELDIMLKDCMLWPTWINLYFPVAKMDHLQANLRLFDVKTGAILFWGNGGPGQSFVVLFSLLNRLLYHGPRFIYKEGETKGLKIDVLTLNLLPGYGETLQPDYSDEHPLQACEARIEEETKEILNFMSRHMQDIVNQGLLSCKVKTVRICYRDEIKTYSVDEKTPDAAPSAEWKAYGLVRGVDEGMQIEKVDSFACLEPRRREMDGEEEEELFEDEAKDEGPVNDEAKTEEQIREGGRMLDDGMNDVHTDQMIEPFRVTTDKP
ncbi:MAG: hypothetical protein Q9209_002634 [Squamulea sp. 1 TL-2023]